MTATPILIAGPTASGKSALALALSKRLGGPVVNADALQVYHGWRVLTARPSVADETAAPHLLYGHVPMTQAYSVGAWLREVTAILDQTDAPPIIIGGTGLYFTALTEGLAEIPPTPPEIREEGDKIRLTGGAADLLERLKIADPAILTRIDQKNPARLQRAWEVWAATGTPLSAWQAQTGAPRIPLTSARAIVLDADRDWLNSRIARRFSMMLDEGALDEVDANAAMDRSLPSARALGADALWSYRDGAITLAAAQEAATIATRQYAKRQRTWFRSRMGDWQRVAVDASVQVNDLIDQALGKP